MFNIIHTNTKERLIPLSKTAHLSKELSKSNCKNTSSNKYQGSLKGKKAKDALKPYGYGGGGLLRRGVKNDAP